MPLHVCFVYNGVLFQWLHTLEKTMVISDFGSFGSLPYMFITASERGKMFCFAQCFLYRPEWHLVEPSGCCSCVCWVLVLRGCWSNVVRDLISNRLILIGSTTTSYVVFSEEEEDYFQRRGGGKLQVRR